MHLHKTPDLRRDIGESVIQISGVLDKARVPINPINQAISNFFVRKRDFFS